MAQSVRAVVGSSLSSSIRMLTSVLDNGQSTPAHFLSDLAIQSVNAACVNMLHTRHTLGFWDVLCQNNV